MCMDPFTFLYIFLFCIWTMYVRTHYYKVIIISFSLSYLTRAGSSTTVLVTSKMTNYINDQSIGRCTEGPTAAPHRPVPQILIVVWRISGFLFIFRDFHISIVVHIFNGPRIQICIRIKSLNSKRWSMLSAMYAIPEVCGSMISPLKVKNHGWFYWSHSWFTFWDGFPLSQNIKLMDPPMLVIICIAKCMPFVVHHVY